MPLCLLAALVLFCSCGGGAGTDRLSLALTLPEGWEQRLDMGALSAPGPTPYIGTVRVVVERDGSEVARGDAAWSAHRIALDGLPAGDGYRVTVKAITRGAVILAGSRDGVSVGDAGAPSSQVVLQEANGFAALGSLLYPRQWHAAEMFSQLSPAEIVVVGGNISSNLIEMIDVNTLSSRSFSSAADTFRFIRLYFSGSKVGSNKLVILGGMNFSGEFIDTPVCIVRDVGGYDFFDIPRKFSRKYHGTGVSGDEVVACFGERDGGAISSEMFWCNLKMGTSGTRKITGMTPVKHQTVIYENGKIFVIGGLTVSGYFGSVVRVNASSGGTEETLVLGSHKYGVGISSLGIGKYLIVGGLGESGSLHEMEMLNIDSFILSTMPPLAVARDHSSQTLLSNEELLIIGGGDLVVGQQTAELYDTVTGESHLLPWRMRVPRIGHTATRLADGRVVVIGGNMSSRLIEVYNPPVTP